MGGAPVQQLSSSEILAKGCQVEVSSDEEGFKGAWYVATIIDRHPKSSGSSSKKKSPKKVFVEYHSLLDEDGSKPLREFVNLKFIRPSPPSESENVQSFELNDVVDAFYRDGWWTGVITRVLDDSRFVVFFQNPPDFIEFGVSELRVHREWVSGKWIRPEKQRTAGLMFSEGKKVEVSLEKEDYRDAWFPATVLKETGDGSFFVEYQSTGIQGGSESVKVIVDLLHIRPSPPHLKDKNFVLLEKVDAYIDFGWWSGVITKELADSRFIVFFKSTNKERELNHSEIRPHMEWKDGNWFSSSQDVLTSSDYHELLRNNSYNVHQSGIAVSLGSLGKLEGNSEERTAGSTSMKKQIELSAPSSEKAYTAMTSLKKKIKLPTPGTGDQHSRPCKKLKEANLIESPSLSPCQLNTPPTDTPSEETHFGLATSTGGDTRTTSLEQSMVGDLPSIKGGNFSQGKKARSKRHRPGERVNCTSDPLRRKGGRPPKSPMTGTLDLAGDSHTPDPSRRKGRRPQISTISSTEASGGDKKDDAVGCTEENFVEKVCVTKEIPVPLNLDCEVMKGERAKEPNQIPSEQSVKILRDQKLQLHDLTVERIKEGNQLEGGGESIPKRRGRPRKLPAQILQASAAVNQENGGVTSNDMVVKECMKNEFRSPTVTGMNTITDEGYMKKPFGVGKKILNVSMELKGKLSSTTKVPRAKKDKLQNVKVVRASAKQYKKRSSKRGRQRTIIVNSESLIQDPRDVTVGKKAEVCEKDGLTKEVEMAMDQLPPNNMSDDQPLSTWFEGMHSPKTVDASSISQGRNVEQCTEANGSPKGIVMQSLVDDVMDGIVPHKDQSLPFAKNTPIWKAIESMEVFQKMPQNPHFRTLDSCKESSREGLAIGYMVTFASVVEKTSKLQFDDPRSIIEENLETLLELESHGFDANKPRNRLTGLLLMKDKLEEFDDQKKEPESLIVEANHSNSKLHETIDKIENQMRMLHEELTLALSAKEKNDSLIASLESTIEGINDGIRSVQLEFEALVAAPW